MNDPNDKRPAVPPNPYSHNWSAERPAETHAAPPDGTEHGEYLEPEPQAQQQQQRTQNRTKGIGAGLVGLGLVLAKFKGLLFLLFNAKWLLLILGPGSTLLLSLWFYAIALGWNLALIFVLMMLAHELGHYFAIRNYGLPAKLPMFIPGLGAYTMGGIPDSLEHDAYIALAGPLTGFGIAAVCYAFAYTTHEHLWYSAAFLGAVINLFNLIPTPPFDGGRIASAFSPVLWIVGVVIAASAAIVLHFSLIFVVVLAVLAVPSLLRAWRGYVDPRAAAMTMAARVRVGAWYIGTIVALAYLTRLTYIAPATHAALGGR